ncbi:MAG TPA: hypothetical protein VIL44_08195 [Micromonospora sp.]
MSAPGPAPQSAPRRRPGPVTAVAVLLLGMGFGGLVAGVGGLLVAIRVVDQVRAVGRELDALPTEVNAATLIVWANAAGAVVVAFLVAAVAAGLALGTMRAAPLARVGTWVMCAIGVLWGIAAAVVSVAQRVIVWRAPADAVWAELVRAIGDGYPAWWLHINAGLCVAQVVGYVVIAVLLSLPSASAFYRRE